MACGKNHIDNCRDKGGLYEQNTTKKKRNFNVVSVARLKSSRRASRDLTPKVRLSCVNIQ